jgi:hypothetical protein
MSNRLEQEFPDTRWYAGPPIGVDNIPHDLVRRSIERGRKLRSEAIRQSSGKVIAAAAKAIASLAGFVRCTARVLIGRQPEDDCWAARRA